MDNNDTKKGQHYFRWDPKKHTPAEIAKFMNEARKAIRKAKGLPADEPGEPDKE